MNGHAEGRPWAQSAPRDHQEETSLTAKLRQLTGHKKDEYSSKKHWASQREHHRLQLLYPGEYVVYRDTVDEGDGLLVSREVLLHTEDIAKADEYLNRLRREWPEEEVAKVQLDYVDTPEQSQATGPGSAY